MTTDYEKTESLENCDNLMSAWERSFVQSVQEQLGRMSIGQHLSGKQKSTLDSIYQRAYVANERHSKGGY